MEAQTIEQSLSEQHLLAAVLTQGQPERFQRQAGQLLEQDRPAANIGNVQPRDVLSVGALRSGLRGDTISSLRLDSWRKYHDSVAAPGEYKV